MITTRSIRATWFPLEDSPRLNKVDNQAQEPEPTEHHPNPVEAWEKTLAHVMGLILVMNNRF